MVHRPRPVDFTKEELNKIQGQAEALGDFAVNPSWKRAYYALAQAACVLDAFQARCEVVIDVPERADA